jgi:hypothetical protein
LKNGDALKSLTTDQQLLKISDALGKMAGVGEKPAIATALFGRGGREPIPVQKETGGSTER